MKEIITVNKLTKTFKLSHKKRRSERTEQKIKTAVSELSFNAYEGEVFGLLGPNGAGKTTTLRMLATLIRPDSGDALIDGLSIVAQPREVRKKIAFLAGELRLEEFFTPSYLFEFFSKLRAVPSGVMQKRKEELFIRFGVNDFAYEKVANLSTGMKQKVSLLISIAHDPGIIIFDEPTNGLDVLTAKLVTDFLLELKSQGKVIIVSTHIFSLIEKISDRVGIITDGKMAVCDTLKNITAGRSLEDVFFDICDRENKRDGIGSGIR